MLASLDRRIRLDAAITAMAADSDFTPVVNRLDCIRGISTLTAFGLAAEIGDWDRLTGRSIGAYLGLVPSEYSSGDTHPGWGHQDRQRPRPTTTGRSRVAPPRPVPARRRGSAALGSGVSGGAGTESSSQSASARPVDRFRRPQKRPVVANAAIARELAGWCWSLAVLDDQQPTTVRMRSTR